MSSVRDVATVDIAGASASFRNRKYDRLPKLEGTDQSPVFKSRVGRQAGYLYHASDGRWHVGSAQSCKEQLPKLGLRSLECNEHTAPSADMVWEEPEYVRGCLAGFVFSDAVTDHSTTQDVELAWRGSDADARAPAVEITGASPPGIDGKYELQLLGLSTSPVFKRFAAPAGPDFWLYHAKDGRWHIGGKDACEQRRPGLRFRSAECQPGVVPSEVKFWEECAGGPYLDLNKPYARRADFQISAASVAGVPVAQWAWQAADAEANSAVITIEGSNVATLNGRYELRPARWSGEAPAFKKCESETDAWLYYCSDGRWRAGGNSEDRNEWRLAGPLRSCVCKAGTLPDDVEWWEEDFGGFLKRSCVRVSRIPRCWLDAWSDTSVRTLQISGVSSRLGDLSGVYDLRISDDVGQPPVFKQRGSVPFDRRAASPDCQIRGVVARSRTSSPVSQRGGAFSGSRTATPASDKRGGTVHGSMAMLLYYAPDKRWHVGNRFEAGYRCFRFYRFDAKPRQGSALQIAQIGFRCSHENIDMSSAVATLDAGTVPSRRYLGSSEQQGFNGMFYETGMEPQKAIDGDVYNTKWLDYEGRALVIEFPVQQHIDAFCFWTADSFPERDPMQWKLMGSMDGKSWTALHLQTTEFATTVKRFTQSPWFAFKAAERRPGHNLRSAECEAGTMPDKAGPWEEFHRGPFGVSAFMRAPELTVTALTDA